MKKIFGLLILMIISTCFFGCKKATISYVDSYVEIYQNETFLLDTEKITNEKEYELNIYSLDETIITISDNIVTPVSVGESVIRIEAVDNKKIFCDIAIKVLNGKVAHSVSLNTSNIKIDMGENKTALNKITINNDATETPQITYDTSIINYDYISGVITALKEGKTTVNIEYIRCKTSFEVTVNNTIYTQLLKVEDTSLFANSEGKLNFECYPANANTYRFWSNSQDLIIFRDGTYQAKNVCTATVYCQYFIEKNRQSEIKTFGVTVVERVTDMSISIEKISGGEASVYAVGVNYKLVIHPEQSYEDNNFTFSNNISLVSDIEKSGDSYIVLFEFKNAGEQSVRVSMIETLGNVENLITKNLDIEVMDNVEINICAKWLAYIINPGNDGKYRIYLNGEGLVANSIEFCAELCGDILSGEIKVYQFINESDKIEINNLFVPSMIGEFTFEVHYEGEILGQVCVIVGEL